MVEQLRRDFQLRYLQMLSQWEGRFGYLYMDNPVDWVIREIAAIDTGFDKVSQA